MHETLQLLRSTDFPKIYRKKVSTLQVNLGYKCNQSCIHCHVNAGPNRKEIMSDENISVVLKYLRNKKIQLLDITGGAPELHPRFRELISEVRKESIKIIDRCNLTILEEPGYEELAQFLADNKIHIVASLPCYLEKNVDEQRGKGVFKKSIRALQKLNFLGYGKNDNDHLLTLVYNPQGPELPPPQNVLESDYQKFLAKLNVSFDNLITITNMPIKRFGSILVSQGKFEEYMSLLKNTFVENNLETVMCKTMISVDWRGNVYDCDFNQMLGLPIHNKNKPHTHLSELLDIDITANEIYVADHCYGCAAGQGSSCNGSLN